MVICYCSPRKLRQRTLKGRNKVAITVGEVDGHDILSLPGKVMFNQPMKYLSYELGSSLS